MTALLKKFRAHIRLPLILAVMFAVYLLNFAGKILSPKLARKWRGILFKAWADVSVFLMGIKVKVRGRIPKPPFIMTANHLSYVDIIVLASQIDCLFVAKQEISSWPFFGRIVTAFNHIFVDRENVKNLIQVNEQIEKALDQGWGIVIFPEGTSTSGSRVLPFRSSLLEVAARRSYPVHYASLSYEAPASEMPASLSVCWWGDMEFFPHFREMLKMKSFTATLTFGRRPVQAPERKELAHKLWHAVQEQFCQVV
jgi:1-acyl-sn-glycerol-3-phosphate acyltransferase